ncbi:hypothetical protein LEP1GSC072_2419 [Leptospira noguchii str. Bonito]|nr:hypothetical protein LEP1GSC072_2419 [Leptospira noguchii str. Bonito]
MRLLRHNNKIINRKYNSILLKRPMKNHRPFLFNVSSTERIP